MEETKLFLITYFAALLGVVPPGLVNMSVAKTCVQKGKRNGMYFASGASFIVLIQAFIAILLAKYIFNNPYVHNILLRTGLVIFILMAVYFFVMAQRKKKEVKVEDTTGMRSIIKGMAVSALNVFPIPYFCALGAALNVSGKVDYHNIQILLFVIAASLGTFSTLYLYVMFFIRIEEKATYFSRYSNYFMAILMLVLVVITLFRIFYG
ncbi:LysE family translocator [Salinimicrobium sp. GXAS 041]|uniref:LysE family translocator n=1 Tax=Salinimicrobium sp. GXAS 041 TaxID=3400806 RepID=UPI003C74FA66